MQVDKLRTENGLPSPYLLFLGDVAEAVHAKTAFGLRDWAPERCLGEWRLPQAGVTADLPLMTPSQARAIGARAMVIGVANVGGRIPASWIPCLVQALEAGLDLIAGMHTRLADIERLRAAARLHGRRLIDVRVPPPGLPIASGRRRSGRRLLTVGTDCALGKKYTALALTREFKSRGVDATFRATGQTGILIAGHGIAIDAVVGDFAAGAAEVLSPDAAPAHWDVIEGQGSLSHPAYAGVSLALLHGSQPDVIVVCHDERRAHMHGYPDFAMPSVGETIAMALHLGRRTNPDVRCGGVALNTCGMSVRGSQAALRRISDQLGLPVADPMRVGTALDELVHSCLLDPALAER